MYTRKGKREKTNRVPFLHVCGPGSSLLLSVFPSRHFLRFAASLRLRLLAVSCAFLSATTSLPFRFARALSPPDPLAGVLDTEPRAARQRQEIEQKGFEADEFVSTRLCTSLLPALSSPRVLKSLSSCSRLRHSRVAGSPFLLALSLRSRFHSPVVSSSDTNNGCLQR